MALTYLVDTNIVSEIVKPHVSFQVQQLWNTHQTRMAIASPTWHELVYGVERLPDSRRKHGLREFLSNFVLPVLPFDKAAASWFSQERVRLSRIGRSPAFIDGQIASVAAANNLILVTRNVHDFINFQGITIENWFESEKK
ncbi:MAG: type II toxin-antitoxin system VapC family toxin [Candidatus Promineifilaceae bacterium]